MEKDKNILVLTALSCIFLGFIVPLILWFVNKDAMSEPAKKYLTHLLNFQLTLLIAGVILVAVNIIPILGQLICFVGGPILWLANFVLMVIVAVKLSNNEQYTLPLTMELIK